ncbi:hypothetical protein B0J11DRAFT_587198 [Dendryphion nanum]|uniref:Uncharacterized protein n=1 Tax=Dendryphion nanum TaxID=256645 RepID=A0A9P9J1N3_9PLEO|nr:hypothetical protein B0J11DRAFT_587198 [Dendryphion nanum]
MHYEWVLVSLPFAYLHSEAKRGCTPSLSCTSISCAIGTTPINTSIMQLLLQTYHSCLMTYVNATRASVSMSIQSIDWASETRYIFLAVLFGGVLIPLSIQYLTNACSFALPGWMDRLGEWVVGKFGGGNGRGGDEEKGKRGMEGIRSGIVCGLRAYKRWEGDDDVEEEEEEEEQKEM